MLRRIIICYSSPNFIRMIKPRRLRWKGHLPTSRFDKCSSYTMFYSGNLKGRHYLGELIIDGRIILKLILKK
jgi:hypothetical protein